MTQMIIANWKMNLTLKQASEVCKFLFEHSFTKQLLIAPPTPYIAYLKAQFSTLNFCAQDASIKNEFGSYTGENSAKFLKSCEVNYAIIGHSERRNLFGETNESVRIKAQNCLDNEITPIICIGEPLEARKNNKYKDFLLEQLSESLPKINNKIVLAYEPIWSIGTGAIPTQHQISEIFELIRKTYSNIDYKMHLVYGGSVSWENCEDLLEIPNISGLLVGGASLKKDELFKMLNS
jgi:triosephosphate isomerase